MRNVSIGIDQTALRHNLARVKQLAPKAKVLSMVKANAYGHGVAACLEALAASDAFGVACMPEALELRQLGIKQPICLIEGVFSANEMAMVLQHELDCTIHHSQQLEWLLSHANAFTAKKLKAWVKLNSGMNRLGFHALQAKQALIALQQHGIECVLMTHFANADQPEHPLNAQQIALLQQFKHDFPTLKLSCCNSAALINWPELHFDYVRPGIMLYGATPFATRSVHELELKPVMQLCAEIIAIQEIKQGESVGYGSTFVAQHDMRIGIVGIGYGDGYPRAYLNQNYVAVNHQLCALVGRVSMDMLAIDLSQVQADIGTVVELWGKTRLVDDVAQANGSIGYELLCRMTQRPQRSIID